MSKQKFNHDTENIEEAVDCSAEELQERINKVLNINGKETTRSQIIEAISNEFNTVELAFMLDSVLETANSLKEQLMLDKMVMKSVQEGGSDEA